LLDYYQGPARRRFPLGCQHLGDICWIPIRLHCAAGAVRVAGRDLGTMSSLDRLVYRRADVGFVWQQASLNLIPYLTGLQNVILPMRFTRTARTKRKRRAADLLEILGVASCASRTPDRMSGGTDRPVRP
jgi:ABC-type lipoprotein export system ATPase subunit